MKTQRFFGLLLVLALLVTLGAAAVAATPPDTDDSEITLGVAAENKGSSAVIYASSSSQKAVQAAIDPANDGDTTDIFVYLPLVLRAYSPPAGVCSTSDGLEIELAGNGGVTSVTIDNTEIPLLALPGGFSCKELSSNSSENLVANPGFDDVESGVPLHWTFISGDGTIVYDDTQGHNSLGSVRIDVPGPPDQSSGYPKSDLIDAEPDSFYTFSAWGKSSGVNETHSPAVRVVELDDEGGWLTQHNLGFGRDSDWHEEKVSFNTSSVTSKLYVYANIWNSYGTFWVDDVRLEKNATGIPLNGVVRENPDGSFTQHVTHSDIVFRFDYVPRDRYVEVHGDIQDLTGEDRAIQVRYALPVDTAGWEWGDDIRSSQEIETGGVYNNVYRIGDARRQNSYPFASTSNDEHGISLAVPMDVPRIYRMAYSTGSGYSIEYDFGLANCTDKIGPGHATFKFIIYKIDEPEWGFRAVAKKYYELYPGFFAKRNEWEGLWIFGSQTDIPNMDDFGFAFDDSHNYAPDRRIYDHEHEIYPMQYTEPWGWWRSFGDDPTEPSYDEKIATLMDDYENGAGTWRGVVSTTVAAETVLNTAPYDQDGKQYLSHPYFWNHWGSWSQNYPENPDPDIPSPNRYEISYAKYQRSNEGGLSAGNWSLGSDCSLDDTIAHNGNYSGKIEITGTSDVQSGVIATDYMTAEPATQYSLSAWGKTQDCGGSSAPCVRAAEYDSNETFITQKSLCYGFGTTGWTQESATFTTTAETAYVRIYANIWYGYGTFWLDDVELHRNGTGANLVENPGLELVTDLADYPCSGFRIDSLVSSWCWPSIENYRREHWKYTDYPLAFSYDTRQPVLLFVLSQYDFLAPVYEDMIGMGKRVDANIFPPANSFYGHIIDVFGCELWDMKYADSKASLARTMAHHRTIRNLLQWTEHGDDPVTHEEMNTYIKDQMFYGMFPSISIAAPEDTYGDNRYWDNPTLYERDRDLFKKYVPIIKEISAAGWEPVPYATCDNPDIKFERYGQADSGLYFTISNDQSGTENGTLTVSLTGLGLDPANVLGVTATELCSGSSVGLTIVGDNALLDLAVDPSDVLVYRLDFQLTRGALGHVQ